MNGFGAAFGSIELELSLPVAPQLDEVPSQIVNEGETLSIANRVANLDFLAGQPQFSLEPGAPAGARIDSVTGVFNWTPSETQGSSKNTIGVKVSDSTAPQLPQMGAATTVTGAGVGAGAGAVPATLGAAAGVG